jgi:ABC-type glucose/galactose transport system permease subunit
VKPELGALIGAIVVFLFFAVQSPVFRSLRGIANWLDPASTLGIMAVAVALLMTGTTALTVGGRSLGSLTKSEVSREELTRLMGRGAELDQLAHELERPRS